MWKRRDLLEFERARGEFFTMKRVDPEESWPESWKLSHIYDRHEIYGEIHHPGYAWAYRTRWNETLRLLGDVLPPGATILDVAAGQGNFSLALAELGYRVTWNDLRVDLADYVRLKYEKGEVTYAPGNAFELQFPELFDCVLIMEVIEHVAHPDDFLRKAAQLVRPGGWVLASTPNGAYLRNNLPKFSECADPAQYEKVQFQPNSDGHIFLLHPEEIAPLGRQAGLELEQLVLCANVLTAGHAKTAPLLRVLPASVTAAQEALTQRLPFDLRRKLMSQLLMLFRKPA